MGPIYSSNGPTLEFEVVRDRNNFLDLQKLFLEMKFKIIRNDGNNLRYDAADATMTDSTIFVNNTLHSLFSECTVTANGIKISNANWVYAHKAFFETEYSNGKEAKDTWLRCQGRSWEQCKSSISKQRIGIEKAWRTKIF